MLDKKPRIPTRSAIHWRLKRAIRLFLKQESKLFNAKGGERVLTGALTRTLRPVFPGWDVDPEYDRYGKETKRSPIASRGVSTNPRGHRVVPDIIVHKRLMPTGCNLLAIEAKRHGDKRGILQDREKLASYLARPLSYEYVALVIFSGTTAPGCSFELFSQQEDPGSPKQRIKVILKPNGQYEQSIATAASLSAGVDGNLPLRPIFK